MSTRLRVMIVAALTAVLIVGVVGPAAAYPRRSYLELGSSPSFWLCSGRAADLSFDGDRYRNVRRDDQAGGRYAYNRDTGKVSFRTGHLDHLFAKFRRGPNEYQPWFLDLRRKSDRRVIGTCQPTTYGA